MKKIVKTNNTLIHIKIQKLFNDSSETTYNLIIRNFVKILLE